MIPNRITGIINTIKESSSISARDLFLIIQSGTKKVWFYLASSPTTFSSYGVGATILIQAPFPKCL